MSNRFSYDVLDEMDAIITTNLKDKLENKHIQISEEEIKNISFLLIAKLTNFFGGSTIYFPKMKRELDQKKREMIIKEFNGANHAELARKYGFSMVWIYKILKDKNNE